MRYAIASDGDQVAGHFGRCEYYQLIDLEEGELTNQERISHTGHRPGQLPQLMQKHQVNCVVAGGAGPMAQNMMEEIGIELILGVNGDIEQTITAIAAGELKAGEDECVHS